jgi:hypothetical protein
VESWVDGASHAGDYNRPTVGLFIQISHGPEDAEGVIELFRIQDDRYRQGTIASRPV